MNHFILNLRLKNLWLPSYAVHLVGFYSYVDEILLMIYSASDDCNNLIWEDASRGAIPKLGDRFGYLPR